MAAPTPLSFQPQPPIARVFRRVAHALVAKRLAGTLFALVFVCAGAATASAQKRIVVLKIAGERRPEIENDIKKLIKPHKTLLDKTYRLAAKRLRKQKLNPQHIKRVARYLEADAIIDGQLVPKDGGYRFTVNLRAGATGVLVKKVKMTLSAPRLTASLRAGLRQRLLDEIDQLPALDGDSKGSRSGFVKSEDLGDGREPNTAPDAVADEFVEESGAEASGSSRTNRRSSKSSKAEREAARKARLQAKKDAQREAKRRRAEEAAKRRAAKDRKDEDSEDWSEEEGAEDWEESESGEDWSEEGADDEDDFDDDEGGDDDEDDTRVAAADEADDTIESKGSGDKTESLVGGPARNGAVVLAGASFKQRNLSFTVADIEEAPAGYKSAAVPGAYIHATLYPMLLSDKKGKDSFAKRIAVSGYVDRVLVLETQVDDGAMVVPVGTTLTRFGGSLSYRHDLGKKVDSPSITGMVGFNKNSFIIDKAASPVEIDVPNTEYSWADLGAGLRHPLSDTFAVNAVGKVFFVLGAGEIQQPEQYGGAKLTGLDADVSAEYWISKMFLVRVGAQYTAFGFNFVGNGEESDRNGDDIVDVGGALDTYVGGYALLGAAF